MPDAASYTDPMARIGVGVLGIVGLLLAAAGLIAALAWGLPALGLNPNGRNPVDGTVRALTFAGTLYAIGAALLAIAIRWLRDHAANRPAWEFAATSGVFVALLVVMSIWMAVLGYWTNIPVLLFFMIGILAPIVLGVRPWGSQLDRRARSS